MTNDKPTKLRVEIVSHCWNYSKLLTYQLSSIALFPPKDVDLTMTVFYTKEDERTCRLLDFFDTIRLDNVHWNWWQIEERVIFRRAIGRNMAALATKADWVWFTDCDQMFREGCLDSLAELMPQQTGPLYFPRYTNCTKLQPLESPLLRKVEGDPQVVDIDPEFFAPVLHTKAIGAVQIARGDIVREIGYCKDEKRHMKPARRMTRAHADVVFRRILGTDGEPLDIPGCYRIGHQQKGRSWLPWKRRKM